MDRERGSLGLGLGSGGAGGAQGWRSERGGAGEQGEGTLVGVREKREEPRREEHRSGDQEREESRAGLGRRS